MIAIKTSNDVLAFDILSQYICVENSAKGILISQNQMFEAGQILRFNGIKFNVI